MSARKSTRLHRENAANYTIFYPSTSSRIRLSPKKSAFLRLPRHFPISFRALPTPSAIPKPPSLAPESQCPPRHFYPLNLVASPSKEGPFPAFLWYDSRARQIKPPVVFKKVTGGFKNFHRWFFKKPPVTFSKKPLERTKETPSPTQRNPLPRPFSPPQNCRAPFG